MAFELSDRKWLLVVSDGARGPSRYTVDAGDQRAVLDAIAKAKARCALVGDVVVRSCYEAGRDSFWLHRWLLEQGIDNLVPPQPDLLRPVVWPNRASIAIPCHFSGALNTKSRIDHG